MQPQWRRWAFPGFYATAILLAVAFRGDDPLGLALYRVTLPLSAFAYGAASVAFGWTIMALGAILNGGIAWYIGYHLDDRRAHSKRAA